MLTLDPTFCRQHERAMEYLDAPDSGPSPFDDARREAVANGLCETCLGGGVLFSDNGPMPKETECPDCSGTGKA